MALLYIECNAGVAGDMLCGALLDLLPKEKADEALRLMNELPLPDVTITREKATTCGVVGTHVRVSIAGHEEHSHDAHEHEGDKGDNGPTLVSHSHHHHEHRSLEDVEEVIGSFTALPDEVRKNARAVYRLIAEAEAAVHGTALQHIHFHEVGTLDAVADVTFACLLMHMVGPDRVIASPVRTGFGEVRCAHGLLPVPAPATALLLQGIPTYAGNVESELCTPTGAALLRHFASAFEERPTMNVEATGYGMGTKELPMANCVRAFLGKAYGTNAGDAACESAAAGPANSVVEVCCNIDDMTAEDIAFACERLLEAGALDAYAVPIVMKKGRPATMVCALCEPVAVDAVEAALFRHTTTLGVRRRSWERTTLEREVVAVDTPFGPVRQKIARDASGETIRRKWEHDDLTRIAREHALSIAEVRDRLG